jgi:D-alanine-D-alanine ligase
MKKLRVIALVDADLMPPDSPESAAGLSEEKLDLVRTEWDVTSALRTLGHEVRVVGVLDDLLPIRAAIVDWKPDIVFNLLEEFADQPEYEQHIVSFLELMKQPYTGCQPRGLFLARDKSLSKKVLAYHGIRSPLFAVFPMGKPGKKVRRPRKLKFPLIVKSLVEEASTGISQASVVGGDAKLAERVLFIHENVGTDAIAEQYIDGRELYVGVLGNEQLEVLPIWEMVFGDMPPQAALIATAQAKWSRKYQQAHGIVTRAATDLDPALSRHVVDTSRLIYRSLGLCGYARLDFRLSRRGELYFIEANPNPAIARAEDFAESARSAGTSYEELIQKILGLGLRGGGT